MKLDERQTNFASASFLIARTLSLSNCSNVNIRDEKSSRKLMENETWQQITLQYSKKQVQDDIKPTAFRISFN
jgi:hypothetical protein